MTIDDLKNCRKATIARANIIRRIHDLKESACSVSGIRYGNEPRSRGEPVSKQQRYVEALEELSNAYEETTANWARQAAAIECAIRSLPPDLGELIRLRYVDGLKWENVNETLYISEPTSKRMHRKAMHMLFEK